MYVLSPTLPPLTCWFSYICATFERFSTVSSVLGKMVTTMAERPSPRLTKHIVRCFLRLADNSRYGYFSLAAVFSSRLGLEMLSVLAFLLNFATPSSPMWVCFSFCLLASRSPSQSLKDDAATRRWLAQLISIVGTEASTAPASQNFPS